jgi:hypothetical protein
MSIWSSCIFTVVGQSSLETIYVVVKKCRLLKWDRCEHGVGGITITSAFDSVINKTTVEKVVPVCYV